MAIPTLSEEQRKAALEKARQARTERMEIKKQIKQGELSLKDVLFSENEVVRKTRLIEILKALPNVGDAKAKQAFDEIGIQEGRRVGGLGVNQKRALLAKFEK